MSGGVSGSATPGLNKPFGFLDILGHSHAADGGSSTPDQGASHKIDGLLNPAMYRQAAIGGAICSWHDPGNGAIGTGGWATVATEYDRQEQVAGFGATTISGTAPLAGATTFTVVSATNISGNGYYVVGQGTNLEVVRVRSVSGSTITLYSGLANGHAVGDPVYWSCVNQGYLAKGELVIVGFGANDVPVLGPAAIGTQASNFGNTLGASRGLTPLQHAYRFCLAVMRCSVIYRDTHPSCVYSANWTNSPVTPTFSNASYPNVFSFGGPNAMNYHYSTTVGSTVTFSTEPNFPGGTVDVFFISAGNGNGGQWNITVSGASVMSFTPAIDARNINAVYQNESSGLSSGHLTGCVYRIKGLAPGVNTITVTLNAVQGSGYFLGWGIEPPSLPLIFCTLDPRVPSYAIWGNWPYSTRNPVDGQGYSTQTATVAAGAGATANSVTLGVGVSASLPGVVGTPSVVLPGDTITIGAGSTQETRRVVSVGSQTTVSGAGQAISTTAGTLNVASTAGFPASGTLNVAGVTSTVTYTGVTATSFTGVTIPSGSQTATSGGLVTQGAATTLQVDANFQWAHTNEACVIGLQDADVVGGGYANINDTQGAISVPGMQSALQSVINEFDYAVQVINVDAVMNSGRGSANKNLANFVGDLVHYSDNGHALLASAFYQKLLGLPWPVQNMATPAVTNKKTWFAVYGDLNATPATTNLAFLNVWANYYPVNNNYPRTAYYKDMRTRTVWVKGAVYNGTITSDALLPSKIFQLPVGYRPAGVTPLMAYSQHGPALVEVFPDGSVYCTAGYMGGTAGTGAEILEFYGSFLAEG